MADRTVTVRVNANVDNFRAAFRDAQSSVEGFRNKLKDHDGALDTSSDRLSTFVQTALALGPALIPLGGAAVTAIAGIGTGLIGAAAGAGVAALAFQGVGEAMTTISDYQAEPTIENFEKMQTALQDLGPAGADFVTFLSDMAPKFEQLQQVARAGMFPGLQDGLEELMTVFPQVEDLVGNFAEALGELGSDAGNALSSPFWVEFIEYIGDEGPAAMDTFLRSVGNVAEGVAGLAKAFGPLSKDFNSAMLDMTEDFAEWGKAVGETEGFEDFVGYLRDTGPQVADTLASIGRAMAAFIEAAAPVGTVVLPVIEAMADAFTALMQTDIGPVLVGAAAGVSALSRGVALWNAANASSIASFLGGKGLAGATKAGDNAEKAGAGVTVLGTATKTAGTDAEAGSKGLTVFSSSADKLGSSTDKAGKSASAAGDSASKGAKGFSLLGTGAAGAVAGVGALALSMVDLENAGSTVTTVVDTATAAMLGFAVGGPIGAAIGGVSQLADSLMDLMAYDTDIAALGESLTSLGETGNVSGELDNVLNSFEGLFNQSQSLGDLLALGVENTQTMTGQFETFLSGGSDAVDKVKEIDTALADLALQDPGAAADTFAQIVQAGEEAGVSVEQLTKLFPEYAAAVEQTGGAANQASRGVQALESGIRSMVSAAQNAIASQNALADAMLESRSAAVSYEQAVDDAWAAARTGARTLDISTEAGRENRTALDGLASAWNSLGPKVQGAAGAYDKARQNFINTAKAMGATGEQARRLAARLLDIPDTTLEFDARQAIKAGEQVESLRDSYNKLPKDVRTDIAANGLPESKKGIAELAREYKLTPKQVKTLVQMQDNGAFVKIKNLRAELTKLGREKVEAKIAAEDSDLMNAARRSEQMLNRLDRMDPKPTIDADERPAVESSRQAERALDGVDRKRPNPRIDADEKPAVASAKNAGNALDQFDRKRPNPKLDADEGPAQSSIRAATNDADAFGRLNPKATLDAQNNASSAIASAKNAADAFAGTYTAVLNVVRNVTSNLNPFSAEGSIYQQNVRTFAAGGDLPNRHQPEIAAGGEWRIWAEPETQGESYIPHAADYRRPRAIDIWRRTGQILGVEFVEYAGGGINGNGGKRKDKEPGLEANEIKRILAPLIEKFGKNSELVQAISSWLESIKEANFSQKALGDKLDKVRERVGLTGPQIRKAIEPLEAKFGKNSEIVQSMRAWLERIDMADYSRKAQAQKLDQLMEKAALSGGKIREVLAPLIEKYGRNSELVQAMRAWLEKIDMADYSAKERDKKLRDLMEKVGLTGGQKRNALGPLEDRFGKRSEIYGLMKEWLDKIDMADYSAKERAKKLDQLLDKATRQIGRQFNVNKKSDAGEVRSEVRELEQAMRKLLGPDAPILKKLDKMGDGLIREARERDKLRSAVEKQTTKLEELRQQQKDYQKSVAANFQTDPFENNNTLAGVLRSLEYDEEGAIRTGQLAKRAARLGLDGDAFEQLLASGNTAVLADIKTKADAQALEDALSQRDKAANALGAFAGMEVYGQAVDRNTNQLEKLQKQLDRQNKMMEKLDRRLEASVERGTERGAERGVRRGTRRNQQARVMAAQYVRAK